MGGIIIAKFVLFFKYREYVLNPDFFTAGMEFFF